MVAFLLNPNFLLIIYWGLLRVLLYILNIYKDNIDIKRSIKPIINNIVLKDKLPSKIKFKKHTKNAINEIKLTTFIIFEENDNIPPKEYLSSLIIDHLEVP